MSEEQPKKGLSPERLEKLKAAREKALAVRQEKAAKLNEIKKLEKEAAAKEIEEKLETVRKKVAPPPKPKKPPKKTKEQVLQEVIDEPSSDDSSSDDDDGDVVSPVKHYLKTKYKQKYKQKYESKTVHQLAKGVAANQLKSKVNYEILRLASAHLFGGN